MSFYYLERGDAKPTITSQNIPPSWSFRSLSKSLLEILL